MVAPQIREIAMAMDSLIRKINAPMKMLGVTTTTSTDVSMIQIMTESTTLKMYA